jgi:GNAT superfamily N-acetyltransferase
MADTSDTSPQSGQLEPSGLAWVWWRGDPLKSLPPLAGLDIQEATPNAGLASLNGVNIGEVFRRVRAGHRPYMARIFGQPVAYGWVATREASFGDGRVSFQVPEQYRYLWDFATLPDWRGQGIYPRLLQSILVTEAAAAERFWILHEWANTASRRGIARAGFRIAGTLYFLPNGGIGLSPFGAHSRAPEGAKLMGVPLLANSRSPRTT